MKILNCCVVTFIFFLIFPLYKYVSKIIILVLLTLKYPFHHSCWSSDIIRAFRFIADLLRGGRRSQSQSFDLGCEIMRRRRGRRLRRWWWHLVVQDSRKRELKEHIERGKLWLGSNPGICQTIEVSWARHTERGGLSFARFWRQEFG